MTGLAGLRLWAHAIWSSHWPTLRRCTVESRHSDIDTIVRCELSEFGTAELHGELPEHEELKVLRVTVRPHDVASSN